MRIFDNLWFDISSLDYFNVGHSMKSYNIENSLATSFTLLDKVVSKDDSEDNEFLISFSQSRNLVKEKWVVVSLNNVFGLIGGYTALLWMMITFVLSGYEAHKFRSSLISSIFLCVPEEMHENDSDSSNELSKEQSEKLLRKRLGTNTKASYSYF